MIFKLIGFFAKVLDLLSGEWMLDYYPNGGTIVLLRSLWVAIIVFLGITISRKFFGESIWSGSRVTASMAALAAVYAALYSRFSSQFNYLAGLFNQISLAIASDKSLAEDSENIAMQKWKAGFIEDAESLHLATKPMFASAIKHFLVDDGVRREYIEFTVGGAQRLAALETAINESLNHHEKKWL